MMSRIEQLIGEIEEYIDGCKYQPLSNSKIVVNRDELEELLVELRLRIPDEIKQYTDELVNEHEIMQKAYAQANEIINQANLQAQDIVEKAVSDANDIRQSAVQYTDDMLKSLQTIISHSMEGAQGRFDAFMTSMQSSYDIVSSNRQELTGAVMPPTEADGSMPIE